jgi:hypothetical protein
MQKTVLSFDVSSTTIGWAVLGVDGYSISLIKMDYLKPIKTGTIIERMVDTRDKVQKIIRDVKPDYIAIEDIIKFMAGHSTAQTIIMLTTFNRMIGLLAYDYLRRSPELFSVMTIRHGLKLNKIFPKKEDMPDLVAKHLGITFPYQVKKPKRLTGKIAIKTENYDMADAVAVGLYYAFLLTGRIKPKGKKK